MTMTVLANDFNVVQARRARHFLAERSFGGGRLFFYVAETSVVRQYQGRDGEEADTQSILE